MKSYNIGIGIARIGGIEKEPYYFEEKNYYAWKIKFSKVSTAWLNNLPFIYLGNTLEEANIKVEKHRSNFKLAEIYEDEMVSVMFDTNNQNDVIAVASLGRNNWIDIRDDFKLKSFTELDIKIASLVIY